MNRASTPPWLWVCAALAFPICGLAAWTGLWLAVLLRFDWVAAGPGTYLASPLIGGTLLSVGLTGLAIHHQPPDRYWKSVAMLAVSGAATLAIAALALLVFLWVIFSGCPEAGCSID